MDGMDTESTELRRVRRVGKRLAWGTGQHPEGVLAGFPFLPGRIPEWSRVARNEVRD